jgi:hypothetical protein
MKSITYVPEVLNLRDMNANGAVTITDIGLLLKFFFLLPATSATSVLSEFPTLTNFFEVNCHTGTSWGGAIFSVTIWAWSIERLSKYLKEQF